MLKDENTRLRVLAEHDWLTGLYNRRAAEAHVDEALLKNGGGVLLVLDIDHFKQVNDRYGHLIGDALLCEAARTLRDIFFPRDIIEVFLLRIEMFEAVSIRAELGGLCCNLLRIIVGGIFQQVLLHGVCLKSLLWQ